MSRLLLVVLMLAGCSDVLRGDAGFAAGRSTIIPCDDKPGALLVVESLQACWPEALGERLSCPQWRQFVREQPGICGDEVVFDSPSVTTLTGYFDEPFDRDFLLGSSLSRVFDLPCNPRGRGAEYEDFNDFLTVYAGDVRITRDRDTRARVEFELYPADVDGNPVFSDFPSMKGRVDAQVCR